MGRLQMARRSHMFPGMNAKFFVPCNATVEGYLQTARDFGDDENVKIAAYSVLWFVSTGREFTGFQRACSFMTRGTAKAMLSRVTREMLRVAKARRGSDVLVTGDLDNTMLAHALGFSNASEASEACCCHPYGHRFTLG